jgi:hypothetical protein
MDPSLQATAMSRTRIELAFPHAWQAEILPTRPLILPPRHYVYPREVEEVERGALEVLIRRDDHPAQPFLATCALGFRDSTVPTGVWSAPKADEICAVSGGYAYLIDTAVPERFTFLPYRPVLDVRPVIDCGLLLFVGHRTILAWGRDGQAWESGKLSDEGVTITEMEGSMLHGVGWNMLTDKEGPFSLDLQSGSILR